MRKLELIGQTFGRLTVLAEDGRTKNQQCKWLCECTCGEKVTTTVIAQGERPLFEVYVQRAQRPLGDIARELQAQHTTAPKARTTKED